MKRIIIWKKHIEFMETEKPKYKAQPEKLPKPTYWPFFLALAVVLMFWGILTSWFITGIGVVLFGVSLTGWLVELYKEISNH